jgi:hypothetical protein
MKNQPRNRNRYRQVEIRPASIPAVAPAEFIRLEKMPIISAGKSDAAARPKASATTWAAKPGGLSPDTSPHRSPPPSRYGLREARPFPRYWVDHRLDEVVRDRRRDGQQQTRSSGQRGSDTTGSDQRDHPAGSCAISGLASTRMSRLKVTSSLPPAVAHRPSTFRGRIVVVLDATVAVLVFDTQKASDRPGFEPIGQFVDSHGFAFKTPATSWW